MIFTFTRNNHYGFYDLISVILFFFNHKPHKRHYLKTTNFYIHAAANILL